MSNFAQQIKGEISPIARKEVRAETQDLKKASAQYRSKIAALRRRIVSLEAAVKKAPSGYPQKPEAVDEGGDSPSLRFRVAGFAALRKKLGISAAEMGKLLGVSAQSKACITGKQERPSPVQASWPLSLPCARWARRKWLPS